MGDCDSASDCAGDAICVQDVGGDYGYEDGVDVCELPVGHWDYCSADMPCGHAQGDCDSDADCVDGAFCVDNAGASYGFDADVDVCELPLGHGDLCSDAYPCDVGAGDCDSDSECAGGAECLQNVGAEVGPPGWVDVCGFDLGHFKYCSAAFPCDYGEGDCDTASESADGLSCVKNVGADYGWDAKTDVCE